MSDTSRIDALLAEKSRELDRAEKRFNLELVVVLQEEIDDLLERRHEATHRR